MGKQPAPSLTPEQAEASATLAALLPAVWRPSMTTEQVADELLVSIGQVEYWSWRREGDRNQLRYALVSGRRRYAPGEVARFASAEWGAPLVSPR